MDAAGFDPTLPGFRLIQSWMREKRVLSIELVDGRRLDGRLDWQDPEYLALRRDESIDPILIARRAVITVRPLI
ncbi:hypothetical protein [Synechococcus sp. NOUM97013]|uniref:Hfq-related RNA-binding protein n=1 Tax=Synechococcus sp. NOUM97013 TaxID=1442555 RepID=UPI001646C1BB|nr:hypothetical protein [Synechococcus sp. NOUM97013]QNI73499.1 hypothetical protein SynNOUM97013_01439 [Synechococcus sp. NOUM97013]